MSARLVLVCDGAAYFDDGSYDYGTFKCSRTFPGKASEAYDEFHNLLFNARAAGWRTSDDGDAMCPKCGQPDPHTVRIIEALGATQREPS